MTYCADRERKKKKGKKVFWTLKVFPRVLVAKGPKNAPAFWEHLKFTQGSRGKAWEG